MPEKPLRPFSVREIGSDLVVFIKDGAPAVIADCGSADPGTDIFSLRSGGKKLLAGQTFGEGVRCVDFFYARQGAVFLDDGAHYMICPTHPFKTAEDVNEVVLDVEFHLINGFEKAGPGGRGPTKLERRRCLIGHSFMAPPHRCPYHGTAAEPL